MIKNYILRLVTAFAIMMDVTFFVITLWHYEGFVWSENPFMVVLWTVCMVWVVLFVYANCYHKFNNRKRKHHHPGKNDIILVDIDD